MPIYTYTKDFRDLDGKPASATSIKDNLSDIQDEMNSMDWENVEDGSLDQSHTKAYSGGSYKEQIGAYEIAPSNAGQGLGWFDVGSVSFRANIYSAVFVAASVSFKQALPPGGSNTTVAPSHGQVRLIAKDLMGNHVGSWELNGAQAMEASGGSGITWAFSPVAEAVQTVTLQFRRTSGQAITSANPVRVNLTAFVVDR